MFYCFPLGNRLRRFPRSRSKPALCPPYVFFTPSSRKRKTPKQNICETNRLISWPLGQVVKTSPFHGGNMGSNPVGVTTSWGYSSAGRARALQARGHRFEPCCPHHIKKRATLCVVLFLCVGKQHRARIRRVIRLCANHCAPVPRSHCTLASKCKHFRFAVDEPCCPHHIKKRATLCVVLFLCVGKQHRARIRRVIRLCANHCAPVPRSHCTLASKCKHFRFAVDEPCCPTS